MGSLFGGSSSPTIIPQTTTVTNEQPEWVQQAGQNVFNYATGLANQAYTPYPGPRIAPFTSDTQAGFDLTRQNVGAYQPYFSSAQSALSGAGQPTTAYQPYFGQAQGALGGLSDVTSHLPWLNQASEQIFSGLSGFDPQSYQDFFDPYVNQVIDNTIAEMNRQHGIQRTQRDARATSSGAFGGARHGVEEAEAEGRFNEAQGRVVGELQSQGFNQAMQNALATWNAQQGRQLGAGQTLGQLGLGVGQLSADDMNRLLSQAGIYGNLGAQAGGFQSADLQRLLSAGGLYGTLGQLSSQLGAADAQRLLETGSMQQQLSQNSLDLAYQDFLNQQQYPYEQLNYLISTLSGIPYSTTQTQQGQLYQSPQPSILSQLGPLALAAAAFI